MNNRIKATQNLLRYLQPMAPPLKTVLDIIYDLDDCTLVQAEDECVTAMLRLLDGGTVDDQSFAVFEVLQILLKSEIHCREELTKKGIWPAAEAAREYPLLSEEAPPQRILLHLGEVVKKPSALRKLNAANQNVTALLQRHQTGDWGDLGVEAMVKNDHAALSNGRVVSVYKLPPDDSEIIIVTEWDRSQTTVLLASQYRRGQPD